MHDAARCVGAWSKLVRLGRTHGLGVTLITQRSAVLNKDVLTQISTLVPMRTTSPQDRKAIEAWVREHDAGADLMASLSSLDNGEGWVWSPHWLHVLQRIRFRRRRTFDSGATPTFGGGIRPAARAADVDLAALKVHLAAAIERAETNDPKALRRRVAELERELDKARASAEVVEVPVEVPVPVVPDGVVAAVGELGEWAAQFAGELDKRITSLAALTASAPARPLRRPPGRQNPQRSPSAPPGAPQGLGAGRRDVPASQEDVQDSVAPDRNPSLHHRHRRRGAKGWGGRNAGSSVSWPSSPLVAPRFRSRCCPVTPSRARLWATLSGPFGRSATPPGMPTDGDHPGRAGRARRRLGAGAGRTRVARVVAGRRPGRSGQGQARTSGTCRARCHR